MPFDITNTLGQIEGWLTATGYVDKTLVGDYSEPPMDELSASILNLSDVPILIYLNGGVQELHVFHIRLHRDMHAEDNELIMSRAVQNIKDKLWKDFDLDQTIRNIDIAGHNGQPYATNWGYLQIGGVMHRIAEITLPLIVDDSVTAGA